MKLNVLVKSIEEAKKLKTYQLLLEAAYDRDVAVQPIGVDSLCLNESLQEMIKPGEAFLRLAVGPEARLAERFIVRPDIKSVYDDWRVPLIYGLWDDTQLMQAAGIPIIPTVFLIANLSKESLGKEVQKLGGYPVVVKATGLSHGRGVFLCHSADEIIDIIHSLKLPPESLAIRKYIPEARHIRTVVIGSKVVDAIEYDQPKDDFRTNAVSTPTAKAIEGTDLLTSLSLRAIKAVGVRFAGVDILLDAGQNPYIAEVNSPCNYARNFYTNGKNLAVDLVELLVKQY